MTQGILCVTERPHRQFVQSFQQLQSQGFTCCVCTLCQTNVPLQPAY